MAVGGVTRKVEGFFEVCSRHGLTGEQGVILPRDNIAHLMLKQEVVAAVNEGRFSIWPVAHITEAMELLTGMPAGRMRADSTFTPGTLYDKVDRRLAELGRLRRARSVPVTRACECYGHRAQRGQTSSAMALLSLAVRLALRARLTAEALPHGRLVFLANERKS